MSQLNDFEKRRQERINDQLKKAETDIKSIKKAPEPKKPNG